VALVVAVVVVVVAVAVVVQLLVVGENREAAVFACWRGGSTAGARCDVRWDDPTTGVAVQLLLLVHVRQRHLVSGVACRTAARGSRMAGDPRLPLAGSGTGRGVGSGWPVGSLLLLRRRLLHLLVVIDAGERSPGGGKAPGVLHFSWISTVRHAAPTPPSRLGHSSRLADLPAPAAPRATARKFPGAARPSFLFHTFRRSNRGVRLNWIFAGSQTQSLLLEAWGCSFRLLVRRAVVAAVALSLTPLLPLASRIVLVAPSCCSFLVDC
jgi:hypothetical protein